MHAIIGPKGLRKGGLTVAVALTLSTFTAWTIAQDPADTDDPPAKTAKDKARSTKAKSDSSSKEDPKDDAEVKKGPVLDANGKVVHTDEEWRQLLTPLQYRVTRQAYTEPPGSGKYSRGKHKGVFLCVGCDAPLFTSNQKFESGTGWPSFWRPATPDALAQANDFSDGTPRIEVLCRRCDAHLGHVFDDGPRPTGLRYCINSAALKLEPFPKADKSKTAAKSKTAKKADDAEAEEAGDEADNADAPTSDEEETPSPKPKAAKRR